MKQAELIEIEIDGPKNHNLYFRPLQQKIRGRFDLQRVNEVNAGKLLSRWPQPIPGQRLTLNLETGEGAVVDPLHDSEHAAIRASIEAKGDCLGPERQTFEAVHLPTWLYWMQGAVDSGSARLIRGQFPKSIEGKPKLRFHTTEQPEPIDRLTAAMERQAELQAETLKLLTKLVADRSE